MDVVLVPGFLNGPWVMRKVAGCLRDAGHECHLLPLAPSDGRGGLERQSARLATFVGKMIPDNQVFAVVAFSMGALVARHYLQSRVNDGRAKAFFSIAGPHKGTYSANLYSSLGVREMRSGSKFLSDLDAGSRFLENLSTTSYWTPFDLMVRPVSSAILPVGENVRIPALLHTLQLFDARLHKDLIRRLAVVTPDPLA